LNLLHSGQKKAIPNIPNKGITIAGTLLYYVIGMGLPIVSALFSNGISMMDIPKGLLLYGGAQLAISLSLGILGYLRVDNVALED